MMLLGHIGISILLAYILNSIQDKYKLNPAIVGFGAILPDIIDKTVGLFFFHSGRWFGHTLLFTLTFPIWIHIFKSPILGILKTCEEDMRSIIVGSAGLGTILHIFEDVIGNGFFELNVFLWPFFGQFSRSASVDFLGGIYSIRTISFEIIGFVCFLVYGHLVHWEKKDWNKLILFTLSYLILLSFAIYLFLINPIIVF